MLKIKRNENSKGRTRRRTCPCWAPLQKTIQILFDIFGCYLGNHRPSTFDITSNFEIHGEWALVDDFVKPIIDSVGSRSLEQYDAQSYLLGIRYLTPTETTLIIEYYHNGQGYTESEAGDFYDFIDAFIDVGTDPELTALRDASRSYQRPNYMRDYFYLRASQKEPFGWLYFNPALTSVVNLNDGSYNVIPEVAYTGITNLELRFRLNMLSSDDRTEYGEKQNDWKAEVRTRYFF